MQATWIEHEGVLMFHDGFDQGSLLKWSKYTLDDRYALELEPPRAQWGRQERIRVVDAPSPAHPGDKALRFAVKRGLDTFRSELALTAEPGFQERWYGLRIYVPADWTFGSPNATDHGDIVTQWHHISSLPSSARGKYPPLALAIKDRTWQIDNNYGIEGEGTNDDFDAGSVDAGRWTAWVFHVKWSPDGDGLLQVWKNGVPVLDKRGPTTYRPGHLRTPYWKIGLYHPGWKKRNQDKFNAVASTVAERVVYVDDVKMGDEHAAYADVAPPGGLPIRKDGRR
ncbi:hypothetical protein A7A76_05430 [Lysobacter enzymogenes]|nr:hypothetical protein [Lysobacter enzymogenes]